jgi:hypothetical protein
MGDERMNVARLIAELEKNGGTFQNPDLLHTLLDAAERSARMPVVWDAAFHSKFLVKTQEVMRRIGPSGDGYEKLSAEFTSSVEKVISRLRELKDITTAETGVRLEQEFFAMDPESFSRLMSLAVDLSRIKNWEIDGYFIPGERHPAQVTGEASEDRKNTAALGRNIPVVMLFLLIAYLLLEPPVTVLGFVVATILALLSLSQIVISRSPSPSRHS